MIVAVQANERRDPQQVVLGHRTGPLLVLGGPGTGKTSLVVELVARRLLAGVDPGSVLVLASSRRAGAELRDRIAARVGRTIREPLARTAHSYAFGLLRRQALLRGDEPPRLLAGAEQQLMITELLAHSTAPWPDSLGPALGTRFFAGQLRDLLLRAVERDLSADDLVRLGHQHDRPLWRAAGVFGREYAEVTALARPSSYDPAELVRAAVDLLRDDPELLAAQRREQSLVVVDDVDEADPALLDLLDVLAGGGTGMVATADPDSTVYGFRGADPQAVRSFARRFATPDGREAPTVLLDTSHRLSSALLEPVARLASRLGGSAPWRHVHPAAAAGDPHFEAAVLASTTDEMAHVAARLRRRHLHAGVAWSRMAVVVRSAGDLTGVRHWLSRYGVPVVQRPDEVALWQQAPVRALLDLLALVVGRDEVPAEDVVDLLLGPLGGLDPARLVSLGRLVTAAESREAGHRRTEQILADAVLRGEPMPGGLTDAAVSRLAATVRRGREQATSGSVEQVLWALWHSLDLAGAWRDTALRGHRDGAAADRDLDAVVAVFEAAGRFTDRMPGAGPAAFLDHVRAQQLPSDSWSTVSSAAEAVTVLTAHATKGREWDTVAVCRVQEDLWPDVRRRQSLLGVEELGAVVDTGRLPSAAEQATLLLAAERRLLHLAISRASGHVLVTAVDDGEARPSRLLDDLDPDRSAVQTVRRPAQALSLAGLVAELRAAVCDPDGEGPQRAQAARLLAMLARDRVAGADPDQWYGLAPATDERPLVEPDETVRLSPSQIEGYLRCPLRWMLQRAGGDSGTALRQSIGTMIHDLACDAARGDWTADQVWRRYEQLWGTIDAGHGWVARRERARVDAMVTRLVGWLEQNPRQLVGAEVEVSVDVPGATVRGRLDRLDRRSDGSLVVIDFKTGTTAPPAADVAVNPQLGVYQWAVSSGTQAVSEGTPARTAAGMLVHLGIAGSERAKEQVQPGLDAADDPQWPRALVEQVVDGVSGSTFAALVNPGCSHCPVRSSCPAHPDGERVVP